MPFGKLDQPAGENSESCTILPAAKSRSGQAKQQAAIRPALGSHQPDQQAPEVRGLFMGPGRITPIPG